MAMMARQHGDGPPSIAGKAAIDARGFAFHLGHEVVIARNAAAAGCANLHESEQANVTGIFFEEALDAAEALDDPLGVVDAVDADAEEARLDAEVFQKSGARAIGRILTLWKRRLAHIDADRERPHKR